MKVPIIVSLKKRVCWYFSTFSNVWYFSPKIIAVSIFLSLASKFSVLAAFILPIKIILSFGSNNDSGILFGYFQNYPKDVMIVVLSLLTIVLYFLHIVSEQALNGNAASYIKKIINEKPHLVLLNLNKRAALSAYNGLATVLAALLFVFFSYVIVLNLYAGAALFSFIFVFVCMVPLHFLYSNSIKIQEYSSKKFGNLVNSIAGILTMCCFLYVVFDFIYSALLPPLIPALIGFVLLRQMFSNGAQCMATLNILYKDRDGVGRIFSGDFSASQKEKICYTQWNLCEENNQRQWMPKVISDVASKDVRYIGSNWVESGVSGVIAFELDAFDSMRSESLKYYIKLYREGQSGASEKERFLLERFPGLALECNYIGATLIKNLQCHVFLAEGLAPAPDLSPLSDLDLSAQINFSKHEIPISFSGDYFSIFNSYRDFLTQPIFLSRLTLCAPAEKKYLVKEFRHVLHKLMLSLDGIPLAIYCQMTSKDIMREGKNGEIIALSYVNWILCPLGGGLDEGDNKYIDAYLKAIILRKDAGGITKEILMLSALVFKLEKSFRMGHMQTCLDLLPLIIETTNSNE